MTPTTSSPTQLATTVVAALAWVATTACMPSAAAAEPPPSLSVGIPGGKSSPWWKVFAAWSRTLEKPGAAALRFDLKPESITAPEGKRQLRILTNAGACELSPALCFGPGLSVAETEARLKTAGPVLAEKGLVLLGSGVVGPVRYFSTAAEVSLSAQQPKGLRAWLPTRERKVWAPHFEQLKLPLDGGRMAEGRKRLASKQAYIVASSPLAVIYLQWQGLFKRYSEAPAGQLFTLTVIEKAALEALPEASRAALLKTSPKAHKLLFKRLATKTRDADRTLETLGLKAHRFN